MFLINEQQVEFGDFLAMDFFRAYIGESTPLLQEMRPNALCLAQQCFEMIMSALVFGVAFFAVVGSTTAFVRFNYPPQAWPVAIAAMTISFGIGQTRIEAVGFGEEQFLNPRNPEAAENRRVQLVNIGK